MYMFLGFLAQLIGILHSTHISELFLSSSRAVSLVIYWLTWFEADSELFLGT